MIIFNKLFYKLVKISNWFIFITSALLIVISSFLIYFIEPETFQNPFNSFWWVMTTVTTVGYGDYYPISILGKIFAIFLYIFGIGLISIVITKVVDSIFIYKRKKEEGKLQYHGENHFVIIDWSRNANLAIQEILNSDPSVDVVLIDQLEKTPFSHERVYYVKGNPIHKEVLDQANLAKARAVFIFSNELTEYGNFIRDTSFVDGKTLLIATTIERNFEHIYTIVEVKERENIHNFIHANIDEFILSSEAVSQLAVRSAFSPGASKIVSQLLSKQHGDDLYEIKRRSHWHTYRDAFEELLREGATLVSEGQHLDINRRLDEKIAEGARLFVICDKQTYQKLRS
ncbi:MAG: ion transporter [Firmicutes bacterium]|nr:ion transporter [Bacillota bacterium]